MVKPKVQVGKNGFNDYGVVKEGEHSAGKGGVKCTQAHSTSCLLPPYVQRLLKVPCRQPHGGFEVHLGRVGQKGGKSGVLCTPKEVQYFRVRVHIILYWLVHVEVLEGVTRTKRSPVQYDITRMVDVPKFEQILITKRRRAAIVGHHYIYKIEDTEGGGLKKQT